MFLCSLQVPLFLIRSFVPCTFLCSLQVPLPYKILYSLHVPLFLTSSYSLYVPLFLTNSSVPKKLRRPIHDDPVSFLQQSRPTFPLHRETTVGKLVLP